jgi:hypothetical protein
MEFLTLHELSRQLNKPEKILRYSFKKLLRSNTLVEGEDYIRDEYTDDRHFIYKINPLRFIEATRLNPVPLPDSPQETFDNNFVNNGYQFGTKLDNNFGTKEQEIDTKAQSPTASTVPPEAHQPPSRDMVGDLIDVLRDQLKAKDEQIKTQAEQLKMAQERIKEGQSTQYLALREIMRLGRLLQLNSGRPSTSEFGTNGYQKAEPMDTNFGNQEVDFDNKTSDFGTKFDTNEQQNDFSSDTPQQ